MSYSILDCKGNIYPQLDDVQLTTQASMQRLHSLFNNMNGATKKRAQAKTEADNVSIE